MSTNYMMDVNDVAKMLHVSSSKAYCVLRELNESLEKEGYIVINGKIPRPYFNKKFYGCTNEYKQKGLYYASI